MTLLLSLLVGLLALGGCKDKPRLEVQGPDRLTQIEERLSVIEKQDKEVAEKVEALAKHQGLEFYEWRDFDYKLWNIGGRIISIGGREFRLRPIKPTCDYIWNEEKKRWDKEIRP